MDIKVNQYINGELKDKELLQFEELLASDPQLAKEVSFYKKVDTTLMAKKAMKNENTELKKLFNQFGEKYIIQYSDNESKTKVIELQPDKRLEIEQTSNEQKGKNLMRWLAPAFGIAAAAMLIFFIGFGEADPNQIAQQYFKPYTADFSVRGDNTNNLALGQQAYDSHDYEKAVQFFSQEPNNISALMAKGNCEFLLNQPENAVATFTEITHKKTDQNIQYQAHWYLALSHLKLDDVIQAKKSLQLIAENSNYYKNAQTILKKLD